MSGRDTPAPGGRRALVLAYDGGPYAGWQVQPDRPTVQGEVEAALQRVLGSPVRVVGAGRTDAGVHALGQVAHFDDPRGWPPARLAGALNASLPAAVRVVGALDVPAAFHALRDAVDKTYVYDLHLSSTAGGRRAVESSVPPLRRASHLAVRRDIDVRAMRAAARRLVGRHDFAALSKSMPAERGTVRTLHALRVLRVSRGLRIVATADGFLYGMVRLIAGLLVEVGEGRRAAGDAAALLASGDRGAGPAALPARGLTLWMVRYGAGGGVGVRARRLLS